MLHLLRKKIRLNFIRITLLISSFIGFQALNAQYTLPNFSKVELNQADHDSKPYYFGITLGVNLARFHTSLHNRFLQYDSVLVAEPVNSGGFALGLSATGRLSDRLRICYSFSKSQKKLGEYDRILYKEKRKPSLFICTN